MVQVKPGVWLRSGISIMVSSLSDGELVECPRCSGVRWTVQEDGRLKCDGCALFGRAT